MTKITIRTIRTTKPQDWMTQTQTQAKSQAQEWMTKPQTPGPGAGVDDANTGVDEIPGVDDENAGVGEIPGVDIGETKNRTLRMTGRTAT